jgi:electron transfer flavoprotein beta subunit
LNIIVCVKQAVDESELKFDVSKEGNLQDVPTKLSTFDKNAVEEGLRIKEKRGGTVCIVSLGRQESRKAIKDALAMGADRGYLIMAETNNDDALSTSYLLSRFIGKIGGFDLILCSEGSSDIYSGSVPPMIAEWLNLPYLAYVKRLTIDGNGITGEEALEEQVEMATAQLPCIASVVSEINEPRYPTLLQIMQASKKPIEEMSADGLREENSPNAIVQVSRITPLSMNRKGVIFEGSPEECAEKLIESLKKDGVLHR